VDLTLTAEQEMLVAAVRGFLTSRTSPGAVRALERDGRGLDPDLWRAIAGLGWVGLELPAALGGSGQSFLETVLVAEEMGRALFPSPFVPTVAVAVPLLQALGSESQRRRWLPQIAAGEAIATVALVEPGWRSVWAEPALAPHDGRLTGRKTFVPFAPEADLVLVATAGPSIALVERATRGMTHVRQATLGGDPVYETTFDDTPVERLGTADALPDALDRGAVATLAWLVGAAERVLAMTVDHARTREQFGRPIGSFQAVAHRCVDIRSDVDALRVLVRQAAWTLATDRPRDVPVGSAMAYGLEAVRRIFLHAHQVHGAIGFSMEHDLQLFTRRAKAAELHWGPPAWHHERVARAMELG
jgi:alkylation response protein AidB-like acyl-CoA dehydrogenase